MIDHISSYATDYSVTKTFYEGALASLGISLLREFAMAEDKDLPGRRACAFGEPGGTAFWVIEVKEASTPRHVAFQAPDRATVTAFHQAALRAGGVDEGPPGLRPIYHENYFGAFVLDPDGNNVEAVCHLPE